MIEAALDRIPMLKTVTLSGYRAVNEGGVCFGEGVWRQADILLPGLVSIVFLL